MALVAGLAAATLFPAVVTIAGLTRGDGYSPQAHWVSLLCLGPQGWIGTTALLLAGTGIVVAGLALGRRVPSGRAGVATSAVTVLGVALLVAGAFPVDPTSTYPIPRGTVPLSPGGAVHSVAGSLIIVAMAAMCLAGDRLPQGMAFTSHWRLMSRVCAALVVISAASASGLALLADGSWEVARAGLFQRVAVLAGFLWLAAACVATMLIDASDPDSATE